MARAQDLVQGTLDMLILKAVSLGPLHGYGILLRIQQFSPEVALALLLVTGAGLMARSFWLLRRVDPGFRIEGVVAVQLSVPASRYPGRDHVVAFLDRLAAELEARGARARHRGGRLPWRGAGAPLDAVRRRARRSVARPVAGAGTVPAVAVASNSLQAHATE